MRFRLGISPLPLAAPLQAALSSVMRVDFKHVQRLPVVGIEVEGTDPTTKVLTADVVNLVALGTRLGFLVAREGGPNNIYGRAVRVVRSMRGSFGDIGVIPICIEWLEANRGLAFDSTAAEVSAPKPRRPAGGETVAWAGSLRDHLRRLGSQAGFIVAEPYIPPILAAAYERWPTDNRHVVTEPSTGLRSPVAKWQDAYTGSQIDMAWLLPLPRGLQHFLDAVGAADPTLRRDGILFPQIYDHAAVIGFEFESSIGKHAAGGLANLSAYTTIGIAVAEDSPRAERLKGALTRYLPTLGFRMSTSDRLST